MADSAKNAAARCFNSLNPISETSPLIWTCSVSFTPFAGKLERARVSLFVCACGNVIEAVSTREEDTFPIEVCSECHPFYTGKQNLGSKKGQVEKFNKKFGFTTEK